MPLSMHALTTVEHVKAVLGIDNTDSDAYIENQINVASAKIERFCGYHFEARAVTSDLVPVRGQELLLNDRYINSITSVSINGTSYTDYKIYKDTGILWREDGWEPQYNRRGLGQDRYLTSERAITVVYNAGFVLPKDDSAETPRSLPYDLEDYCVESVKAAYYGRSKNPLVKSEALQSHQVSYDLSTDSQTGLPLSVVQGLRLSGWVMYA